MPDSTDTQNPGPVALDKADKAAEAEAVSDKKPDEKPKPQGGGRWKWIAFTILVIFLGGAVLGIWFLPELKQRVPYLAQILPTQSVNPDFSTAIDALKSDVTALTARVDQQTFDLTSANQDNQRLSARLDDLETRVDQLASTRDTTPSTNQNTNASEPVTGRMDMLAARLSQLEAAFVPIAKRAETDAEATRDRATLHETSDKLAEQIANMGERISNLEAFAARDRQGSVLGLTFAALRHAIDTGQPFDTELNLVMDMISPDSQAGQALADPLAALQRYAPEGVPTLAELQNDFDQTATNTQKATAVPADGNWLARAWGRLKSLITIRQRGDVTGSDTAAILARAETRLADDDLDGTLDELATLNGPAAAAATGWVKAATARQDVDNAANALSGYLSVDAAKMPQSTPAPIAGGQNGGV